MTAPEIAQALWLYQALAACALHRATATQAAAVALIPEEKQRDMLIDAKDLVAECIEFVGRNS